MVGQRLSLRARALSFLSRREHSRAELAAKLLSHTDDPDALTRLLDDFEQRGWLSEKRFVEQTVNTLGRKFGVRRITHTLRTKGISDESIAAAMPYLTDNELGTARKVLNRKYPTAPTSKEERAKQMRFLKSRGFDYDVIRKALCQDQDQDEIDS